MNNLRELRHKKGLTIEDLSCETGIAYRTISYTELNKSVPKKSTIEVLCEYFNISESEFNFRKRERKKYAKHKHKDKVIEPNNLRKIRREKGMSVRSIYFKTGVSEGTIYNIERMRKNARLSTKKRLSLIFDIDEVWSKGGDKDGRRL